MTERERFVNTLNVYAHCIAAKMMMKADAYELELIAMYDASREPAACETKRCPTCDGRRVHPDDIAEFDKIIQQGPQATILGPPYRGFKPCPTCSGEPAACDPAIEAAARSYAHEIEDAAEQRTCESCGGLGRVCATCGGSWSMDHPRCPHPRGNAACETCGGNGKIVGEVLGSPLPDVERPCEDCTTAAEQRETCACIEYYGKHHPDCPTLKPAPTAERGGEEAVVVAVGHYEHKSQRVRNMFNGTDDFLSARARFDLERPEDLRAFDGKRVEVVIRAARGK